MSAKHKLLGIYYDLHESNNLIEKKFCTRSNKIKGDMVSLIFEKSSQIDSAWDHICTCMVHGSKIKCSLKEKVS
jgi:hypothetical protein